MKTIKLSEGDMVRFRSALHISEEIIALLLPVLTAVENEAEPDTHLMVRAIKRIAVEQYEKLRGLAEVLK
ncbi:hypothetical protein B9086_012145 [Morganella morganii subsp. morganii]|uniref:hypothetical protein n=1 Tax=Morganella morganii TaxID=582 RepID=UPI000B410FBC|nr:hypothetical protein [Morganella morganii]RNW11258.1 hypothetical protein B9086_012145 [Morganella morganii subsp. morganii]